VPLATAPTPSQPAARPAPAAAPAPAPVPAREAPAFDYAVNLNSDAFGANLFTGAFARESAAFYNPNYVIAPGDQIQVRLWGAYEHEALLPVDALGNIFLPHVGPVKVMGTANGGLQKAVDASLRRVFRSNVYSYVSLAAAQPVRVFVTGFVHRPGMYHGNSGDSFLRYIDQAGGIDAERGSFLDVQIRRGSEVRATLNLYDFLLQGSLPHVQMADGDVVVVQPRKSTVKVAGLAENPRRFEFADSSTDLAHVMALAKPRAQATHVRVTRNTGTVRNIEYFALPGAGAVPLSNGDEVEFTADKKPGTITVRVEGEHLGANEYVLPYGSRLGELVRSIEFSERSDAGSLQLYRQSVRERQQVQLQVALQSLESSVLTARSGTSDEAKLRKEEADLVLQWVERAKKLEPRGQVLMGPAPERDHLLLENGDVLRVPAKDNLVLVSGEVLFPNAVAHDPRHSVADYVRRAGGYAQNADASRIVVAHRDGSFDEGDAAAVRPGDEVLVLPKVEVKERQVWKDLTQILFQLAVSAKVVLGL
jgi:protein involved in polysaccharide export with SLBB domain